MTKKLKEWYEVKVRGMIGPDRGDMKEITILNRTVRLEEWGISYKADNKHMERIISGANIRGHTAYTTCTQPVHNPSAQV